MAQFSTYITKRKQMNTIAKNTTDAKEPREDFNIFATIAMIFLVLTFIGTSFYILISSYMEM